MAKEIPSAGQREPGGGKMIAIYFIAEPTVLKNAIPPLKKEQQRKPLPPLKKEQWKTALALTVGWDRSVGGKNSTKALVLGRRDSPGIRRRDGSAVTSSHVFWPNQRRKVGALLPIWLRNPHSEAGDTVPLLPSKANFGYQLALSRARWRGRGGS